VCHARIAEQGGHALTPGASRRDDHQVRTHFLSKGPIDVTRASQQRSPRLRILALGILFLLAGLLVASPRPAHAEHPSLAWARRAAIPAESAEEASQRHQRVAQRRGGVQVIVHRGALEFAQENTLEAYRASFELGADGNEIDIRSTQDGVLICFHDDMLDHILHAYGDASDYTWDELRRFSFRNPGPFGPHCRIPTLIEVLELHRREAGLIQLDIKRPDLDAAIAVLLDRLDMWDQIVSAPENHGAILRADARFRPGRYKASLYLDHSDLQPDAIDAALKRPGEMVMVEDPRGIAMTLGRKWRRPSTVPYTPNIPGPPQRGPMPAELRAAEVLTRLRNADDWDQPRSDPEGRSEQAARILDRARAADAAALLSNPDAEILAALEERVRRRSLHFDWRHHGLDGASALRALFALQSDRAVTLARFCLFRDDPALAQVKDPQYTSPRSWSDFRVKLIVFRLLREHKPAGTAALCRDYLVLPEEQALEIGPAQYDEAARALLAVSPDESTALELLRHERRDVRGRAILECLRQIDQPWARSALQTAAPHALNYVLPSAGEPPANKGGEDNGGE